MLLRQALALLVRAARPLLGFRVEVQEPPDTTSSTAGRCCARQAWRPRRLVRARAAAAVALSAAHRHCAEGDTPLGSGPRRATRAAAVLLHPTRRRQGAGAARRARPARCAADDAILLFPEGGNWTPGRHSRAIARLLHSGRRQAAADAAENRNVLPPQPTGMLACLAGRPDLTVAVVAHTGLEDLVSPALIWRALPVMGRPMIVRWWFQPARSLPVGEEADVTGFGFSGRWWIPGSTPGRRPDRGSWCRSWCRKSRWPVRPPTRSDRCPAVASRVRARYSRTFVPARAGQMDAAHAPGRPVRRPLPEVTMVVRSARRRSVRARSAGRQAASSRVLSGLASAGLAARGVHVRAHRHDRGRDRPGQFASAGRPQRRNPDRRRYAVRHPDLVAARHRIRRPHLVAAIRSRVRRGRPGRP